MRLLKEKWQSTTLRWEKITLKALFQQMNEYMEEAIRKFSRGWLDLGSHYLTCFIILFTPELNEKFNVSTLEEMRNLNFSREQCDHMARVIENERKAFEEKAVIVDKILHGDGFGFGYFYMTLSDDYEVLEKLYYCDKKLLNDWLEMEDHDKARKLTKDYLTLTPEKLYAMRKKGKELWYN